MTNVFGIWIGDESDYESNKDKPWSFVLAAKEPFHRKAIGYTTPGAPKGNPEYLICRRPNKLILNLVDADQVDFIIPEVIDSAIAFIEAEKQNGREVCVICNQGKSRSASIAFLYLFKNRLCRSLEEFRAFYPKYAPGRGMAEFVRQRVEKMKSSMDTEPIPELETE